MIETMVRGLPRELLQSWMLECVLQTRLAGARERAAGATADPFGRDPGLTTMRCNEKGQTMRQSAKAG